MEKDDDICLLGENTLSAVLHGEVFYLTMSFRFILSIN